MFIKNDEIFGTYVGHEGHGPPTVAELIEALQHFPQDTEVILDVTPEEETRYSEGDRRPYNHDCIQFKECNEEEEFKFIILTGITMGYGS